MNREVRDYQVENVASGLGTDMQLLNARSWAAGGMRPAALIRLARIPRAAFQYAVYAGSLPALIN